MGRPIRKMIMRSPFLGLRKKSSWIPKLSKHTTLESFIDLVKNDVQTATSTNIPTHNNLTPAEKGALQELKERDDIVIKSADKGSAIVVMDKVDYLEEANRQLTDERFYKKLDSDPTEEFSTKITQELKIMKENSHIDKNTFDYLKPDKPKVGRFYLLPKIHKVNNPGRPIVSANGHPTEKISEFVDFHLRPHVEALPSHLKDTTDYLQKMESMNPLPSGTILVSMDVTSLYTNIPHNDGIEACREAWDQRAVKEPPTECLVQLLTLVLKHSNFTFNGEHFLQINGTAMGTKMAPSYANIFMGKLEKLIIQSAPHKPLSWFCFIDDVDMKWTESEENLNRFFDHANNVHPTIKFTHETSRNNISFLDTYTTCENGIMSTDIYNKPTDKHQYLSPQSCHPKHCTKSIPYSQALRIKRICSNEQTTKKRLGELKCHLKKRGYNNASINHCFNKASGIDRKDLIQYKEKNANNRVPFVITYHPALSNLSSIVREHWTTIQKHPELCKIFKEPPVLAFRKPKSLKDILVRADISPRSAYNGQCQKCDSRRCMTCKNIQCTQKFSSTHTGEKFIIYCNANCKTENIIYLLECAICGLQYIGETKQQLSKRLNGHRSDANCKPDLPLSRHLRSTGHHDSFGKLKVTIIDHNPKWDDKSRQERESFWIRKLKTLSPNGINEKK